MLVSREEWLRLAIIVALGGELVARVDAGQAAASDPAPAAPATAGERETGGGPEAGAVLEAAESLRNPKVSFAAAIALRSTRQEDGGFVSTYAMKAADRERALIVGTSPEHYRGRILLRAGRQYYLHLKSIKNPLRVAPQQAFRGDVANADIARADYLADYEPALAGEELIDGKPCHVLELNARANDVAYRRLRYWIEKGTWRPVKTEHYAVSGRILKTVFYEDYRRSLGAVRPQRMRIVDGVDPTLITVIEYTDVREATFPDRIFNPGYLPRLEELGEGTAAPPGKKSDRARPSEEGG